MMRDNWFRAWDEERKVIVSGNDIEDHTEERGAPRYMTGLSYGKLFVAYTALSTGEFTECKVMQATGIRDKNGKEVYEGDVVRWLGYEVSNGRQIRPPRIIIVGQGYYPPIEDAWHGIDFITDCYHLQNLVAHGDKSVEVIGNIFEHPALLEAK